MSCNNSLLLSEDDIRTKVVYQWLKDCGFSTADIWIEYSINIRIGKGIKTINSRADVLVKSTNGLNLLIVEVKRPDHPLDEQDKKQALSYARSLAEGGIAPFTILTNGNNDDYLLIRLLVMKFREKQYLSIIHTLKMASVYLVILFQQKPKHWNILFLFRQRIY